MGKILYEEQGNPKLDRSHEEVVWENKSLGKKSDRRAGDLLTDLIRSVWKRVLMHPRSKVKREGD